MRRWIARLGPERAGTVLELARAEARTARPDRRRAEGAKVKEVKARVEAVLAARPPLSIRDLRLGGVEVAEALGTGPGPRVGEALRHLLDRVLDEPELNDPERLRAALREWSAAAPERI